MQTPRDSSRSFDIDDPVSSPLVLVPDDADINWGTEPLPPPRARYKRNPDDIGDHEQGVTSDWNFVLPGY
jgi:hypothetical protein